VTWCKRRSCKRECGRHTGSHATHGQIPTTL
jgi:hypothetical protein